MKKQRRTKCKKEWLESTRESIDVISERFARLEQKGKKVKIQKMIADESDVLTLKNIVVKRAGYKHNYTTKSEYLK